jgi:hypothetical protein
MRTDYLSRPVRFSGKDRRKTGYIVDRTCRRRKTARAFFSAVCAGETAIALEMLDAMYHSGRMSAPPFGAGLSVQGHTYNEGGAQKRDMRLSGSFEKKKGWSLRRLSQERSHRHDDEFSFPLSGWAAFPTDGLRRGVGA